MIDKTKKHRLSPVTEPLRQRGAGFNPHPRFEKQQRQTLGEFAREKEKSRTVIIDETARTVISSNQSPDIGFNRSINPYRGCEHGCIYCYARPAHAYVGLSPGIDFETRIFAKNNAGERLREELSKPGHRPETIVLGSNVDPYQPIEKSRRITRSLLETLLQFRHPVGIVTKSALILRDLDLLQDLARRNLVRVGVSITTLDPRLARAMEPRAATPARRLQTLRELNAAGIPTVVMNAPIIPALNEAEIDAVLKAARETGTRCAGYVLLRLPREVAPLFEEWLHAHVPLRAERILSAVRTMRGGKLYDSAWGQRMQGQGPHADLIRQRFLKAMKRCGYRRNAPPLDSTRFRIPRNAQIALPLEPPPPAEPQRPKQRGFGGAAALEPSPPAEPQRQDAPFARPGVGNRRHHAKFSAADPSPLVFPGLPDLSI